MMMPTVMNTSGLAQKVVTSKFVAFDENFLTPLCVVVMDQELSEVGACITMNVCDSEV